MKFWYLSSCRAWKAEVKRVKSVGWGYGNEPGALLCELKEAFSESGRVTPITQSPVRNAVSGHWRIVWMELWDQEYIDLPGPGYIRIDNDGSGEFQFGAITGGFHTNPESACFDSTWEGSRECDEARGEIFGTLDAERKKGKLCSTIAFWEGHESEYRAIRFNPPARDKKL